jgi:c-di-GMP-binding flagellar brake protein YcgR
MGLFDPIRVNRPVDIELPGKELERYSSNVVAISENNLVITLPVKNKDHILLKSGIIIKVIFSDNIAIYTFTAEVVSQNSTTPVTVNLGKPIETRRIQRRNFVRLDTRLKVTLEKLDEKCNSTNNSFSATTVDISGGGMMFSCSEKLELGDFLESMIFFDADEKVSAIGRVVRVISNQPQAREKYSVGFEFAVIDEAERDKIIKYIFTSQRELLRKGLI